ncbi:MAG: rhodanese-like domain-containing protein [Planctomycetota bacterium]|nr:rhodanese-like domain-containing protein [Planctomycetota bacterium]
MSRLLGRIARGCLLAILPATCLIGCSNKTSDRSLVFVPPADAEQLIRGQRGLLGLGGEVRGAWLDPRSRSEYLEGHIPGAVHRPFEDLRDDHADLDQYDLIIVYGDDYNTPVALAASKTLMELGFEDVRTLRGGLRAWKAAGNPIEAGEGDD